MKYLIIFLVFSLALVGNLTFAQPNDYTVGKVQFPDRCYSSVGSGTVIIVDPDMNKDPAQVESVPIQLWASADTDIRTPNATETGKDTGIFEAKVFFNMTDEAFSQRIRVLEGDMLYARYIDKTVPSGMEQTIETFVVMGTLSPDQKWGKKWGTLSVQYNSTYVYDTCMAEFFGRLNPEQSLENLNVVYPSPLKQTENGLHANEIRCKESLTLVTKYSGSPACVSESTKQKLIERGWTKILPPCISDRTACFNQESNICDPTGWDCNSNEDIFSEIIPLPESEVNSNNIDEIIKSNNQFALDFYSQINNESENIFFSPWSISNAFAIVNEGARGDTAKQINDVFGFSNDAQQRQIEFKLANDNLNRYDKEYSLSVANALWLAMDFTAKPEYVDVAKTYYDSNVESVDFKTDGIDVINSWVENKTQEMIKDLFEPGSLDGAVFAITNAIYFKGTWANQFDPAQTRVGDFWVAEESPVSVPMMFMPESNQKVALLEEVHMIEIPYEGNEISMLVLLPSQRFELDKLESVLDAEKISQWKQNLQEKSMAVIMPKLKLETDYDLIPYLHALGISHAFDSNANFDGISDSPLFIGEAIHKAFVDINEEGTEAAAATGVGGFVSGPSTFEIDQPFIFIIQDTESGKFLFVGRVMDPT